MPSLKRILKPRFLLPLMEEARCLLGETAGLAVIEKGEVLASTGVIPTDPPSCEASGFIFPLSVENELVGSLAIFGTLMDAQQVRRLGGWLANALQRIINAESARRAVNTEALEQYREVSILQRAATSLNRSLKMKEVTGALMKECIGGAIPAEMGMVFGIDSSDGFTCLDSIGPVKEVRLEEVVRSELFRNILAGGRGEIINDLSVEPRWAGEVPGIRRLLCMPLTSPGHWGGALILASRSAANHFSAADLKRISAISSVTATAMANAHHFEEVRLMLEALLRALATAIDARDPCTAGHSQRVARLAVALARWINSARQESPEGTVFSEDNLQELYYAGLLHDVGKIGVREEVLTKSTRLSHWQSEAIAYRLALWGAINGSDYRDDLRQVDSINRANVISEEDRQIVHRLAGLMVQIGQDHHPLLKEEEKEKLLIPRGNLTPQDWEDIRRHPAESERILSAIPFPAEFKRILDIIRQHHEKLDGSGYPDGLESQKILLQSRILAIVDIHDALTAKDRPYKRAMPREKALAIIQEEAKAGKLDPEFVAIFCINIEAIESEVDSPGV